MKKGKAAFIFLDQEKAFDRMSHQFIFKTLRTFGFGENFIKWVKIVYTNTKSAVKVNGFLTSEFSIERGVRQGCPLSALLYVLCAEVLAIEIRSNKQIVGYKYGIGKEQKISQYADDTNIVITTLESLTELFNVLDKYETATNARLNKSKTQGLWVGEWKNREDKPLNLKWTSDKVMFTGVYVGNDRNSCSLLGFSEVFDKIKTKLAYWKGKFLSLKGRIKVLNVFVLAKLWYCLECQDLPKNMNKDLDKLIADFVWNDIHQRELDVLYRKYENGGLNLQDSDTKMKTFRSKWMSELLINSDPLSIERFLADTLIGNHGILKGLKLIYASNKYDNCIKNEFYKNVIKTWRLLKIIPKPGKLQDIRRDGVFDNLLLVDENGKCFKRPSHIPAYAPEYMCDLPITNHPREFRGVYKRLIPKINKAYMKIEYSKSGKTEFCIRIMDKDTKLSDISFNDLYNFFLKNKNKVSNLWVEKWKDDTGMDLDHDQWVGIWKNVHDKSLNYKVQSSVWETIHRNYMCAYFAKIAFNKSATCMLCKNEQLTRTHIFLNCEVILECYRKFQKVTDRIFNLGTVQIWLKELLVSD